MEWSPKFLCGFMKSPVALSDGRVTTCTKDCSGDNAFASLYEHAFPEIAQRYRDLRLAVMSDPSLLPHCHYCYLTIPESRRIGRPGAKWLSVDNRDGKIQQFLQAFNPRSVILNLELSSKCDLRCVDCFVSQPQFRSARGAANMDIDRLLEWLSGTGQDISQMRLYHLGETWLNPRWAEFTRAARMQNSSTFLFTSTNGALMGKLGVFEQLPTSGINHILFSIHGARQSSVKRYMGRSFDLRAAFDAAKRTAEIRDRHQGNFDLSWRYVLTKWNDSQEEIHEAKRLAQEIGFREIHFTLNHTPSHGGRFRIDTEDWRVLREQCALTSSKSVAYQRDTPMVALYVPAPKPTGSRAASFFRVFDDPADSSLDRCEVTTDTGSAGSGLSHDGMLHAEQARQTVLRSGQKTASSRCVDGPGLRLEPSLHFNQISPNRWSYVHSNARQKLWVAVFDALGPTAGREFVATVRLQSSHGMMVDVSIGRYGASNYEGANKRVCLAPGIAQPVVVRKIFGNSHDSLKLQLDVLQMQTGGTAELLIDSVAISARSQLPTRGCAMRKAYIANFEKDSVSVIDLDANACVANIPTQHEPQGIAVAPNGERFYVGNYGASSVTVFDAQNHECLATIPVGSKPVGMRLSPDGSQLYVATQKGGGVTVIDCLRNKRIADIDIGQNTLDVSVNPVDGTVYAANCEDNAVYVIDPTEKRISGAPIAVDGGPVSIAVNSAGTRLYVVCQSSNAVAVIDPGTRSVIGRIPVGSAPFDLAITPNDEKIYVTDREDGNVTVVDAAANEPVGKIFVGGAPTGIDVDPQGTRLYVANWSRSQISVLSVSEDRLIASIPVMGVSYTFGRFFSPIQGEAELSTHKENQGFTVKPGLHFRHISRNRWRYLDSGTTQKIWIAVFNDPGPTAAREFAATIRVESNRTMTVRVSIGREGSSEYEGAYRSVGLVAGIPQDVSVHKEFSRTHQALKVQLEVLELEGGGTAELLIDAVSIGPICGKTKEGSMKSQGAVHAAPITEALAAPEPVQVVSQHVTVEALPLGTREAAPKQSSDRPGTSLQPPAAGPSFRVVAGPNFTRISANRWGFVDSDAKQKLWVAVFENVGPTAAREFGATMRLESTAEMGVRVSIGRHGGSEYEGALRSVRLAPGIAQSVSVRKEFARSHEALKIQLEVLQLQGGQTAELLIDSVAISSAGPSADEHSVTNQSGAEPRQMTGSLASSAVAQVVPLYPTPGALAHPSRDSSSSDRAGGSVASLQSPARGRGFKVLPGPNFREISGNKWSYVESGAKQKLWVAVFDSLGQTEAREFAATMRLEANKEMAVRVSIGRHGDSEYEGAHRPVTLAPGIAQSVTVRKEFTHTHEALKVQLEVLELQGGGSAELLIDSVEICEPISDRLAIEGGMPVRARAFGPRWIFDETDRQQVLEVLDRAPWEWRQGYKVREFSGLFAQCYGMRNAIPTGCGTSAIHAAIGALNPSPMDEIITTPVTDIGSVIGILMHNLIPVFVDWDPASFNMDPADIERKITERTRAILVVHIFGNPCDMDSIMRIAKRHSLPVIEDCAQAHFAEFNGRMIGSFGDMACFSMSLKTLTTDQGGFVLTNDDGLAARVRGFLSKGSEQIRGVWEPYWRLGTYSPMTDLQAAIGVAQLAKLEAATRMRENAAKAWDAVFNDFEGFTLPARRNNDRPVYYVYPYCLDPRKVGGTLDEFVAALKAEGIQDACGPYIKGRPLYRAPLFVNSRTYGQSGFPFIDESGLTRVDYRLVKLPVVERMLPNLGYFHYRNSFSDADVRDIARAIKKVATAFSRRAKRTATA
ncbi:MAG: DegT/DnrJ/EryC1/StrS family aminotransferase [Accumulibacter sp.]|jgi:perosamine synthetase|uniref:DegT/DnrJ/EryC1/StrS family aminotransferase n=1 Tax=Accumulibacter sp. TaxID=2053492 RepID=UPI002FC27BA3